MATTAATSSGSISFLLGDDEDLLAERQQTHLAMDGVIVRGVDEQVEALAAPADLLVEGLGVLVVRSATKGRGGVEPGVDFLEEVNVVESG